MSTQPLPLDGMTVVDLTELLPGPYATLLLQQMGARVIKVERPSGDPSREISPGMFASLNRDKECLRLNLKHPHDVARLEALVAEADVFMESFRPGVLERLGLGAARLMARHPRLVYVSLTGYGQTGKLRDEPGHDTNYAALAGLAAISGEPDGPPSHDTGLPVGDLAGSMFAVTAALGALLRRGRTGRGEFLDISITDALLHWMTPRIGARMHVRDEDGARFKQTLHTRPAYGIFKAGDGRYLALGALETPFWKRLVVAMARPEFDRPGYDDFAYRGEHAAEIASVLERAFLTRDLDHWQRLFAEHDVPCSPVQDIDAALACETFNVRGQVLRDEHGVSIRFPAWPPRPKPPATGIISEGPT
jgi:CoA:oxalate CoA-transferase